MTIDLVVTDLDGTLWGPDEVVHPDTMRALRELENRALPVLVATGRSRRLAYTVLGSHDIVLDAALHDGALGTTTTGELFHHQPFDDEALAGLLAAFAKVGLEPILEVDDADLDFIVGAQPSIRRPVARPCLTADLSQPLPMPVFRAIAVLEPDVVQPLTSALLESGTAESWAARGPSGEEFWFIARPMSCSKWIATLSYCERVGADPGRVLAIGDGHNDLELLAHAHVSVGVRGGAEPLLELADHVVDDPAHGGWAAVLDLL